MREYQVRICERKFPEPTRQERRFHGQPAASGLPLWTDIGSTGRHVSKVPQTDSCTAANKVRRISSETRGLPPSGIMIVAPHSPAIVRLGIFDGHCDFAMRCDGCHQSLRLSRFSISLLRPSVVSSASAALD